jgi:1,2-diacylglycerol 3-beta-glucosyltransferase
MTLLAFGLVLLLTWPVYHLTLVACSWRGTRPPGRREHASDDTRPSIVWIVVPCLNEERVVARTVRAALGLATPGARTEVLVVDDGSDDGTPGVLAAIDHPRLHVLRREPPNARRGKGAALNAGYRWIRAAARASGDDPARVVVGVIDGDGRGESHLLAEVARFMADPTVGAVQCRVRIHNRDRLLGAVQDIEFACIANANQVLRDAFGTVGLGGNGQFARLTALIGLGDEPWSQCLVEDLELGLRLHLGGVRVRYVSHAAVTQQGVVDPRRLLRQRTRWAQGNLQCGRYLPRLIASRRISNSALLEMLHYLFAPWFNAVGTVALVALWSYACARLIRGTPTPIVATFADLWRGLVVWLAVLVLPGLMWAVLHRVQLRDERLSHCLRAGLAYPCFLLLGVVSTWRAIGRHLAGRSSWAKTERLPEDGSDTMALPEVHLIAGTRPEAIKLAPVRTRMREEGRLRPVLVASGQHPTMVTQALAAFGGQPDAGLLVRRRTGSQPELLAALIERLDAHLAAHDPAAVMVQGDTTTALAGALAAFWRRVPVVHLEAGLRTGDLARPFPEEANRRLVAQLADLHLAPTAEAATNLLDEGVAADRVLLTGNTVVDAALEVVARHARAPFADPRLAEAADGRLILLTAHRRESWGIPLDGVLLAVRSLLQAYPDTRVVVPTHPNPDVRAQVDRGLRGSDRAVVTDPLPYASLVSLLARSHLVLTDSGGIQEEAPTFGVPVLVLREATERMESVRAGCARLVGTDPAVIAVEAARLLDDPARRAAMVAAGNPYGDGRAAQRAEQAVASLLGLAPPPEPMPLRPPIVAPPVAGRP